MTTWQVERKHNNNKINTVKLVKTELPLIEIPLTQACWSGAWKELMITDIYKSTFVNMILQPLITETLPNALVKVSVTSWFLKDRTQLN